MRYLAMAIAIAVGGFGPAIGVGLIGKGALEALGKLLGPAGR